ncbi:hypothetical protein [Siminovitchia terrae]|uniref:hypothetical protein n=1 Tax=Siminovitchia terrae TaxID=1914933 RepID=UPI0028A7787A|nr:hypothetical protein [Siminovitchia terrae]
MNAYWYSIQWGFKPRLNKVKASGGCHRFSEEIYRVSSIKSGRKYAKAHLMRRGDKLPGLNTYDLFIFIQIENFKGCFFLTSC